jgi:hypothetical protein
MSVSGQGEDMKVKNLNGATHSLHGGNWLAHWEKYSGQNAYMCFAKGCIKRPIAGGRVQKDSLIDATWYVIPLCSDCNKKNGQDLDIWDAATFVSTNVLRISVPRTSPLREPRVVGA